MGIPIRSKTEIQDLPAGLVNLSIKGLISDIVENATTNQLLVSHLVYSQGTDLVSLRDFYRDNVPLDGIILNIGYPNEISKRRRRDKRTQPSHVISRHQQKLFHETIALGQDIGAVFVPLMSRSEQNSLVAPYLRAGFKVLHAR